MGSNDAPNESKNKTKKVVVLNVPVGIDSVPDWHDMTAPITRPETRPIS